MADSYLAPSLARLRSQVDAAYPKRSKASDGWIGDSAHATTDSDHNPDAKTGVVRALDLTVNTKQGEAVLAATWQDPRVYYVIWRKKIYYRGESKPRAYNGINAHQNHIHISILRSPKSAETDNSNWKGLGMAYMSSPMEGRFTSGYNPNRYITLNGKRVFSPHLGIDIAPPVPGTMGTPVYAMIAGTVEGVVHGRKHLQPASQGTTVWPGYSGNGLRVRNADGEQQLYIHMRSVVKNGAKVKAGDLLGYTDDSGVQTGPHIHVTFLSATGQAYDPMIVFRKHGVTPGENPLATDWLDMIDEATLRKIIREETKNEVHLALHNKRVKATGTVAAFEDNDKMSFARAANLGAAAYTQGLNAQQRSEARDLANLAAIEALANSKGANGAEVADDVARAVEAKLSSLSFTLTAEIDE